ncbi:archaetidylserine synthase [Methanococcoides sp. SA1]|nr:archaetidylserine synthase [Methanococcoides sp. SA1]
MTFITILKIPDVVTLGNAMFGILSIFSAFSGNADLAFIFILLAAIADGADGFLARRMGASAIGENLDSLADAISFGTAPAVVIFLVYGHLHSYLVGTAACIYVLCGVLRLARFNTKHKAIPDFEGLPITAAGVVLASYLLMEDKYILLYGIVILMLLLSYLMISEHPYPKLRHPKAMAIMVIIFMLPIFSYFVLPEYLFIFATLMFLLMLLYLESPLMKIPRQYYDE